jgi:AmmeMemoRadiSam system protein B
MAGKSSNQPVKTRPAAVAGRFYPADPIELRRMVEGFLSRVELAAAAAPKAIIAPHAGYIFSGPIAASAYARFAPARPVIKRIILIGPSHFVPFEGLAAAGAEAFATPLGLVPVDTQAVGRISALPQVVVLDEAHAREHSLEVQLPFLQVALGDFQIVPLLVNEAAEEAVAGVMDALWGGPETRFVISSDLSHYHACASAREMDAATGRAIEKLRPEDIAEDQACGRVPICGLLHAARRRGLSARTVDLRNSGDTAGPRNQVVGYGAFVFEEI